jgi:disease resistance protein RPM1
MLVNYLDSKSYLVVLDDVWDINLWSRIRVPLQEGQLESRVVLTTRKEDIASYAFGVKSCVHHIHPLREKDTWDLFSKKAFFTYPNKSCPSELEPVAWKILGKCDGLPLAIVALGDLMSSKESYADWSNVYNSLNWHLANDPSLDSVKNVLLLSFNDLPEALFLILFSISGRL